LTKNDSPPSAVTLTFLKNPPSRVLVLISMSPFMYTIAPDSAVIFSPELICMSSIAIGSLRIWYCIELCCIEF
jgi:hypothetical protein